MVDIVKAFYISIVRATFYLAQLLCTAQMGDTITNRKQVEEHPNSSNGQEPFRGLRRHTVPTPRKPGQRQHLNAKFYRCNMQSTCYSSNREN